MRNVIYARKSTDRDDRQAQSLDSQIREMGAIALRDGNRVDEVIQEARSAKDPDKRPEFARMVRDIKQGRIKGVYTWNMNRLARNLVDGGIMAHLLQTGKLSFIRTPDRILRPEDSALLISVENGMSTDYIKNLSKDVVRGQREKAESGWHVSKAPIGYRNDLETRGISPDPGRFELLRQGWELLLTGRYSLRDVHQRLVELGLTASIRNRSTGPVSYSCIHKALRDPFYAGLFSYAGRRMEGKHLPMVSKEEFANAQRILDRRSWVKRPSRRGFAFNDVFRCSICGCSILGESKTKRLARSGTLTTYTYYHCTGVRGCSKRSVNERVLAHSVAAQISKLKMDRASKGWVEAALVRAVESEACDDAQSVSELQAEASRQEARLRRLTAMRVEGEISAEEFTDAKAGLTERASAIRERLHRARFTAAGMLGTIRSRLQAAVLAGELKGDGNDPFALGRVLFEAGPQLLDAGSHVIELDPILQRIAAFEPKEKSSQRLENSDLERVVPWWSDFVNELRTAATGFDEQKWCGSAPGTVESARRKRSKAAEWAEAFGEQAD